MPISCCISLTCHCCKHCIPSAAYRQSRPSHACTLRCPSLCPAKRRGTATTHQPCHDGLSATTTVGRKPTIFCIMSRNATTGRVVDRTHAGPINGSGPESLRTTKRVTQRREESPSIAPFQLKKDPRFIALQWSARAKITRVKLNIRKQGQAVQSTGENG